MKNAVILHGLPDKAEYRVARFLHIKMSRIHWLGWLRKRLQKSGYRVYSPDMPNAYKPDWKTWTTEIEKSKIGPDTMLIGHSCGGGFWLRYLSERPKLKVGKVVLVAPWIDVPRQVAPDFFNFKIDKKLIARTAGLTIIYSNNDMRSIKLSVDEIKKELPQARYKEFKGYGHFTIVSMKTRKFPELLDECIK